MTQLPAAARDQQMREAATVSLQLYACDRCGTVGIQMPTPVSWLRPWPVCSRILDIGVDGPSFCHGTMHPITALLSPESR